MPRKSYPFLDEYCYHGDPSYNYSDDLLLLSFLLWLASSPDHDDDLMRLVRRGRLDWMGWAPVGMSSQVSPFHHLDPWPPCRPSTAISMPTFLWCTIFFSLVTNGHGKGDYF